MHPRLIRVSMVVTFLYGSIVWGVFPIESGVSWQGHLAGAALGGFLAIAWRKQGPQRPIPPPEDEEEEIETDPFDDFDEEDFDDDFDDDSDDEFEDDFETKHSDTTNTEATAS